MRVRAAVRVDAAGTAGLAFGRRGYGWATEVAVAGGTLSVRSGGRSRTVALPGALNPRDWHELAVEVRDGVLRAQYGPSGLPGHEVVTVRLRVGSGATAGHFGVRAGCGDVDDVTVARLYRPVEDRAPLPQVGRVAPAYSDTFSGGLEPEWAWVREPTGADAARVENGQLLWPTQRGDLTGDSDNASVLLRDAPAGDYTVEIKVTLTLGENDVRNFQQAGLVVYSDDDDFLRFTHVAIWNTRTTEYGKEQVFADRPAYGSMLVAPPSDTTWLRLSHRVFAGTGEHAYRAAVSTDGVHWTWGGTWTLPVGTTPRIGLVSHGAGGRPRSRCRPPPPCSTTSVSTDPDSPPRRPKERAMTAISTSGFSRRNFLGLSAAVGAAGFAAACGGGTSGPARDAAGRRRRRVHRHVRRPERRPRVLERLHRWRRPVHEEAGGGLQRRAPEHQGDDDHDPLAGLLPEGAGGGAVRARARTSASRTRTTSAPSPPGARSCRSTTSPPI